MLPSSHTFYLVASKKQLYDSEVDTAVPVQYDSIGRFFELFKNINDCNEWVVQSSLDWAEYYFRLYGYRPVELQNTDLLKYDAKTERVFPTDRAIKKIFTEEMRKEASGVFEEMMKFG